MDMVNFVYHIEFVSGTLKGITTECNLEYPLSSKDREVARFKQQIEEQQVIPTYYGSQYVIKDFSVTNFTM